VQTAAGWTVSGAQGNASGVKVTNGPADTAPSYGWLDTPATSGAKIQFEYELCLKCHSSYTTLQARDPLHPSWAALDKGREFNPANVSTHPVEAAGKNQSTMIDCSLSGKCAGVVETDTTYRLWSTFTKSSTVRCTQCHGVKPPGPSPSPGDSLQTHTNANRGLLIQSYRDRVLHQKDQTLALGDFALCFSCHTTAPFTNTDANARPDTAFGVHGKHIAGIGGEGECLDTEIDHAQGVNPNTQSKCATGRGAGSGNAICSECHFRTHSTTYKVGGQGTYPGLVNFAPNVTSATTGAGLSLNAWVRTGTSGQHGSCTLTCHGYSHNAKTY
jgi:hypothetical protein